VGREKAWRVWRERSSGDWVFRGSIEAAGGGVRTDEDGEARFGEARGGTGISPAQGVGGGGFGGRWRGWEKRVCVGWEDESASRLLLRPVWLVVGGGEVLG